MFLRWSEVVKEPGHEKPVRTYIELSGEARALLDHDLEESGQPLTVLLTRLVAWYVGQDASVRREVRTPSGDPAAELVRIRLAALAASGDAGRAVAGMSFEDTMKTIRTLLDRLEVLEEARVASFGAKGKKK